MRRPPLFLLAAGLALTLPVAGRAEALRPFCAQRPGIGTPPCILDAGRLQLEVGLADETLQRQAGTREVVDTVFAPALRLGLTRRTELELSGAPFITDSVRGDGRERGAGDTTLGLMTAVTDPDADDGTAVSLLVFANAPTATHGLGAGGWTGGASLPTAISLGGSLSLGLTPEVDVLRDEVGGGTHLSWSGVVGLSRDVGPFNLGAELWGEVEDEPAGALHRAAFDVTAALPLGRDTQLDAGAAFGLNDETPDSEIYVGIARRF